MWPRSKSSTGLQLTCRTRPTCSWQNHREVVIHSCNTNMLNLWWINKGQVKLHLKLRRSGALSAKGSVERRHLLRWGLSVTCCVWTSIHSYRVNATKWLSCVNLIIHLGQSQWDFMENFMILNIINFADMTIRKKDGVLWDVMRVSSGTVS